MMIIYESMMIIWMAISFGTSNFYPVVNGGSDLELWVFIFTMK